MMNLTKISAVSVLAALLSAGLFALPQPNKANAAKPAAASRPETRNPETVNADPYGEGWLVRVRLTEPGEAGSLMDAEAYRRHLAEQG